MWKSLFQKQSCLLSLGITSEKVFILRAFLDNKPASIRQVIDKVSKFRIHNLREEHEKAVSPQDIIQLRNFLLDVQSQSKYKPLQIQIDPAIVKLNPVSQIPDEFGFFFDFDSSIEVLECIWPEEAHGWKDGWFTWQNQLFQIPNWRTEFNSWIIRNLGVQDIPYFMERVLPEMKKQGIPVQCSITIQNEPPLMIEILDVSKEQVLVQINWNCRKPQPIEGKELYVLDGEKLYHGTDLMAIKMFLSTCERIGTHQYIARQEQIAAFHEKVMDEWSLLIVGNKQQMKEQHPLIQNAELVLNIQHRISHGIGEAYAFPILMADEVMMPAQDILEQLGSGSSYVYTPKGWISAAVLQRMGIYDFEEIPKLGYSVLPSEVIYRSSKRLEGPWKRVRLEDVMPTYIADPLQNHLEYLLRWGVPGGVAGGTAVWSEPLQKLLQKVVTENPHTSILVVGKKNMLLNLQNIWNELTQIAWLLDAEKAAEERPGRNIIAAAPSTLKSEWILRERFDWLIFLEPDDLTKSKETQMYQLLYKLKARLRTSFFSEENHIASPQVLQTHADLIRLESVVLVKYAVFDVKQPSKSIAQLSKPQKTVNDSKNLSAELHETKAVAVQFVEEAHSFALKTSDEVPFKPFSSRWPMYTRMNTEQLHRYFFWRGEVRKERYPQTDLSYIVLYLYEVINGVGWQMVQEGQQLIRRVWRAYHKDMSALSKIIVQWEADFARLHQLELNLDEYLDNCPEQVPLEVIDMKLFELLQKEPLQLPFKYLSLLSLERLDRTLFLRDEGREDCEIYVPKVMNLVSTHIRAKHNTSLLEMFPGGPDLQIDRPYFVGAITEGKILRIRQSSIMNHKELRQYITDIMVHSVSVMEAIRRSKRNLPQLKLEDQELGNLINRFLERELKEEHQAPVVVKIDSNKLSLLEQETKVVQQLLTVEDSSDLAHTAEKVIPAPTHVIPPEPIAQDIHELVWNTEGLSEEWIRLAGQLKPIHLKVIQAILQKSQMKLSEISDMYGTMPDLLVDEINQLALDIIGDLLVDGNTILEEYLMMFTDDRLSEVTL
ncbi:hypothetical protein ABE82_26620 (plasmid) [Paenibacillus peoriae]|uniref:TerB N-terminal domain-containing protein n=1 Tax=Paenibacillus peoriae TaxID=59893 RepID=UPI00071F13C5|nr:TerB N-terminal domain-containing protein [Paenibacillus peoriae]ALS09987.1 hypothetical protein ABE82_26620 [Paenibacillus peoriae]